MNISKKFSKNKLYFYIFSFLVIAFSITRGMKQTSGGDFHAFWVAGRNYISGIPIYGITENIAEFIYPPFAAMFFSIFGLIPFEISAIVFSMINGFLYPATVYLTFLILKKHSPLINSKYFMPVLILGFISSFKFFLNNLVMVQVNNIVFFLCLLGIYYYLEKKLYRSTFFFMFATFLKLTPALFLVFIFITRFKNIWSKALKWTAFFIISPHIFRYQFIKLDLLTYYSSFIEPILKSGTSRGSSYANQSLGGVLNRTLTGSSNIVDQYGFKIKTIANFSPETIKLLFLFLMILFIIAFIVICLKNLEINNKPAETLKAFASIFLMSHILSPVSWKHHLVSLLFVNAIAFTLVFEKKIKNNSWALVPLFISAIILFSGLLGSSIIGKYNQRILGAYGVYTFSMIAIFIFLFTNLKKDKNKRLSALN